MKQKRAQALFCCLFLVEILKINTGMQLFSNYNFNSITTSDIAINEIIQHIHLLISFMDECGDRLTQQEFDNLATNIAWLKRFYEAAERCILNDH